MLKKNRIKKLYIIFGLLILVLSLLEFFLIKSELKYEKVNLLIQTNIAYHLAFWFIGYGLRVFTLINYSDQRRNVIRDVLAVALSIMAILLGFGMLLISVLAFLIHKEFIGVLAFGVSIALILGGIELFKHLRKEKWP